jgi:hypothetical protein
MAGGARSLGGGKEKERGGEQGGQKLRGNGGVRTGTYVPGRDSAGSGVLQSVEFLKDVLSLRSQEGASRMHQGDEGMYRPPARVPREGGEAGAPRGWPRHCREESGRWVAWAIAPA